MKQHPIRTIVALEHGQGAERAVDIALSFGKYECFELSIVACVPRSAWVVGSPLAGAPTGYQRGCRLYNGARQRRNQATLR